MNYATININVQIFVELFDVNTFVYISRSEIIGSYGNSTLNFILNSTEKLAQVFYSYTHLGICV